MENSTEVPQKAKNRIAICSHPATSFLGVFPDRSKIEKTLAPQCSQQQSIVTTAKT